MTFIADIGYKYSRLNLYTLVCWQFVWHVSVSIQTLAQNNIFLSQNRKLYFLREKAARQSLAFSLFARNQVNVAVIYYCSSPNWLPFIFIFWCRLRSEEGGGRLHQAGPADFLSLTSHNNNQYPEVRPGPSLHCAPSLSFPFLKI